MSQFFNSVKIRFGVGSAFSHLSSVLAGRTSIIVSSPGTTKRGLIDNIRRHLSHEGNGSDGVAAVFDDVPPNPTVENMTEAALQVRNRKADVIIAVGGGSVMDLAKGLATLRSQGVDNTFLSEHLREKRVRGYSGLLLNALLSVAFSARGP